MEMTFEDYIKNPMGRQNAVFSKREMFHKHYVDILDKILVREGGKLDYVLYNNGDRYLIHFKIPSEVIEKFYYDTVIEFYPKEDLTKNHDSLNNYFVNFYSNDPSFVYTFAHAFIENDIFIKDLVSKMSNEAVKQVAKVKNPKNIVGYVKSIYFAYLIMKNRGLFKKQYFKTYGVNYNKKDLLNRIEHASVKVEKRKEAGELKNKKKKIEATKATNNKESVKNKDSVKSNKGIVQATKVVKNVLTSVTSKRIKNVKRK